MTDDFISFTDLGTRVGKLVEEKDAAYGSSVDCAGDFLKLLFHNGIQPNQYGDALLLVRIFDKMKRIATNKDAFGESPFQDIAGYGLLGLRKAEREKWMASSLSAIDIDPEESGKAMSDAVERPRTMGEAMTSKDEHPAFPSILGVPIKKDGSLEPVVFVRPGSWEHIKGCLCSLCSHGKIEIPQQPADQVVLTFNSSNSEDL